MTRPTAQFTGEDGNIFNLPGIASKALKSANLDTQISEMRSRVFASHSYTDALAIISEYVEVT